MEIYANNILLLKKLCIAEIGERFSFHTMRGLLILYMTKILNFSNQSAYAIFATFSALLYFFPLIGGYIADKYLGTKNTVQFGALLLISGYLTLALSSNDLFYTGLGLISIGSGFFMPNIASSVAKLYRTEAEKESGFSIFYTAINIGAFLPPFIIAGLIARFGWHAAFYVAATTTLLSYWVLHSIKQWHQPISYKTYLLAFIATLIILVIFSNLITYPSVARILIVSGGILFCIYIVFHSFKYSTDVRKRLYVGLLLTGFSAIFWALSEQTALSLAIFTEFNVKRSFYGFHIPTILFFSLNPFFIIVFGLLFGKLWVWLDKKNLNPSIPAKFALGTILMGAGFIILPGAILATSTSGQIDAIWLLLSYLLQSLGELLFSPIGFSMITELSPKRMWGLMMGIWYLATAIGYLLSGFAAQWTIVPSGSNNPIETAPIFAHVFGALGLFTIALGVLIYMLAPIFNNIITSNSDKDTRYGLLVNQLDAK